MMPNPQGQSQDEVNLFLLSELERLNLLIETLQQRGVVRQEDLALAQLQQELKHAGRELRVAAARGNSAGVRAAERTVRELEKRIDAISAGV